MIDKESSLRLKLLRFPAIIGVVYVHAYGTTVNYAGGTLGLVETNGLTEFIRNLLSQGLARIAVPLFFLMSGYLFFANFRWSKKTYLEKLQTRLRSLLVPMVFWNILGLALVALVQAWPSIQTIPYFIGKNDVIAGYTIIQYFNAILGLKWYPFAYHFWFIRDLILLALLAPVIAVILRFAALPFFIVVYLCWVFGIWPLPEPVVMGWVFGGWPIVIPAAMGVFFFSAGALCGINGQSLFAFDRFGKTAVLVYLPILLVDVICYKAWFNPYLHRTGLIFGVAATLYATKLIMRHQWLQRTLVTLGSASFFVYAAHEPLLGIARTFAFKYIPLDYPYTMLLLYLTIPVLVMASLVLLHRVLMVYCPRALGVVTGGR
ncbi:MAG: acyltransferase [Desulfobulbaceae bacterium]|nr:acyltransferase [Desulfobulbaceae bacterium]